MQVAVRHLITDPVNEPHYKKCKIAGHLVLI